MPRVLTTFGLSSQRTVVSVGGGGSPRGAMRSRRIDIGGDAVVIIAGPRVVDGRSKILEMARRGHAAGADIIRAGTWRPFASAHALHGLALDALEFLDEARSATGAPIATEVLDPRDVERIAPIADLLLVGAQSMQNRPLLAEVGRAGNAVVLERGGAAALDELLDAAEHIMAHGNSHVVLCERGIRSFEPGVPALLDISAIPRLKSLTHLPVIVAPGEACGQRDLLPFLVFAAIAAGADGIVIDVHSGSDADARGALAPDGTLTAEALAHLIERLRPFAHAAGRTLSTRGDSPGAAADDVDGHRSPPVARPTPEALAALRSGIEQVDRRIIELIGQRVELARGAGQVKRDAGLPVIDEDQEHEVLARVRALAASAGLPYDELHALQAYLIEISRRAQTHPRSSRD